MLEFLYFSMKIWRSSNKLIRSQISGCLVCGRKCDMAQIKTKSSVLEIWELPRVFPVQWNPSSSFRRRQKILTSIVATAFKFLYLGWFVLIILWNQMLPTYSYSLTVAVELFTLHSHIYDYSISSDQKGLVQILMICVVADSMAFFRSSLCSLLRTWFTVILSLKT